MGLRLLKAHTQEYLSYQDRLKQEALEQEALRWCHLTSHKREFGQLFIDHFHDVLDRSRTSQLEGEQLGQKLSQCIQQGQLKLVTIQGNLEIPRLRELIVDLSPRDD